MHSAGDLEGYGAGGRTDGRGAAASRSGGAVVPHRRLAFGEFGRGHTREGISGEQVSREVPAVT